MLGGIRTCPIMMQDHRADDYHNGPYADAKCYGMQLPIELPFLHFFKVIQEMNGEDDDIDGEDHMHVNVNHAADHFAESHGQIPAVSHVEVDAERDGDQEDAVGYDQVEKGDGGP